MKKKIPLLLISNLFFGLSAITTVDVLMRKHRAMDDFATALHLPADTWAIYGGEDLIYRPQTLSFDALPEPLQKLHRQGLALMVGPLQRTSERLAEVRVSPSIAHFGFLKLSQGRWPDRPSEALYIDNLPSQVVPQSTLGSHWISGLGKLNWFPYDTTGNVLLTFSSGENPEISSLDLFLVKCSKTCAEKIQHDLGVLVNAQYRLLPLSEFAYTSSAYTEHAFQRLYLVMSWLVFGSTLLLMVVIARYNWIKHLADLQVERALGRSQRDFLLRWVQQFLWSSVPGVLLAVAVLVASHLSLLSTETGFVILASGVGLLCALLFVGWVSGIRGSKISMARPGYLSAKWQLGNGLLPGFVLLLILPFPFLVSLTVQTLQDTQRFLQLFQTSSILVRPNAEHPVTEMCSISGLSHCLKMGVSHMSLWEAQSPLDEQSNFTVVGQFDVADASKLGIQLVSGRWPQSMYREAVLNTSALPDMRRLDPELGVGTTLRFGYRVVGLVDTRLAEKFSVFTDNGFYGASLYVAEGAPDLPLELFQAPVGSTSYQLAASALDSHDLARKISQVHPGAEIMVPTLQARAMQAATRASVQDLVQMFIKGVVLTTVALFFNFNTALIEQARSISICRMLGMSQLQVLVRLMGPMLQRILLGASLGVVAGSIGMVVALGSDPLSTFWRGLGWGALSGTVLLFGACGGVFVWLLRTTRNSIHLQYRENN